MICDNCAAEVPKTYNGSDGRNYCCAGCLFHPLGCRCKFGELGMVQDDYPYEDDIEDDDLQYEFEDGDYPEACTSCGRIEDWCICNEEAF